MNEWKEYKLGEILNLITKGTTPPKGVGFVDKGINYIKSDAIGYDRKFDKSKIVQIDNKTHEKFKRSQLAEDDILFSMAGIYLGKNAIVPKDILPANTNQALAILRINQEIASPSYVSLYLSQQNVVEFVNNMSGQSAQPNLNFEEIKSIEIQLPSLPEQKAISSILNSLDDKIELLHRQNATLEKMAETLFRQWFEVEAKEDWEDTTLQQHTDTVRGLSYKGSGLAEIGKGLPMHNLNSVNEGGGYKYEGIKFYTGEYKDRHIIFPGEIIVTNTEQGHEFRLIGFPAIVPNSFGNKGLFSQHIYKLVPKEDSYLSRQYIYYLLLSSNMREQIIAATNGSTVNMLAIDGLQRPEFKLPPQSLVKKFTEIVSKYWEKKDLNQTQIRTLTALRDALLPKLMSGEVRVQIN
ncbi:restriction endonuclease subunit S [Chitinophaga filiformis]|uniref:Restriction endonuclease subunit S n=1 Tax=Chitinophaga filiformis TaxID=104663 RepID=A0ABY4I6H1_CHIFI|nr:restriction endonuclease subunit S [Chitinophaga filiformis]UPK70959.1 restriction endonuclease subunit S [Chitinophaga filiformis]